MMVKLILPALLVLASACGGSGRSNPTSTMKVSEAFQSASGEILTWEDLDRYDGKMVSLEGKFGHIKGIHGTIVKSNGLRLNIPHFDLFARGEPWGEWDGKIVQAVGILHSYPEPNPIPGSRTPTLEIRDFHVVGNAPDNQ